MSSEDRPGMRAAEAAGQPVARTAFLPAAQIAIRVEQVSKCYQIYESPRDRLKQFILPRLQRLAGGRPRRYHREFWALSDVSFEVRRGETVGIIGRNGAGKSTLLQIICGTMSPTSGTVETYGRVAALLELGAGFNPEFSGRENIFLNGAVLGLSREQVEERFADIAAFADIGEFLDQPVKTYSSGMYVRLAFAVQACIDPEILIVDEALSVGDIGFQYKCFKRMEELRARGVTILMVTHSTGSILEYANRCIVLDAGRVTRDSTDVLDAVLSYEKQMRIVHPVQQTHAAGPAQARNLTLDDLRRAQSGGRNAALGEKRFGSARAIIDRLTIHRAGGEYEEQPILPAGEEVVFRFRLLSSQRIPEVALGISLSGTQGGDVWGDNNLNAGVSIDLDPGECLVEYRVRLPISAGEYLVHCGLACLAGGQREELDQRRPTAKLGIWSSRAQVGVVYAPVQVSVRKPA